MDSSLRGEIVIEIADAFVEQSRTRRIDKSLNEARTYYVVHDGDLNLLKEVVAVAVALIPKFNPIATLPTLVGLLFRYRRKRAAIDDKQAAVLLRLRATPSGCTVAQLDQDLAVVREQLGELDVEAALQSLRAVVLSDGTQSDFVAEKDGVWRAVDV